MTTISKNPFAAVQVWLTHHHKDSAPNFSRFFFGKKIYLSSLGDDQWVVQELNMIQRIARWIFGFYKETHRKTVDQALKKWSPNVTQNDLDKQEPKIVSTFKQILNKNFTVTWKEDVAPLPKSIDRYFDFDSTVLKQIPQAISHRKDFLQFQPHTVPPIISKSFFVPDEMVIHLMRNKKDKAIADKYVDGDQITCMEAALHTFVTPLCSSLLVGDFHWFGYQKGVVGKPFGNNQMRPVVMSAAIQPDFENNAVMVAVLKLEKNEIRGEPLPANFKILSAQEKRDPNHRMAYEQQLKRHLVYHLTKDQYLPPAQRIKYDDIIFQIGIMIFLEELLELPPDQIETKIRGKFLQLDTMSADRLLSQEMLFNIYVQQIRNEFRALQAAAPNGYVYTIDPPAIFAKEIGAMCLNRMQALAFKYLSKTDLFSHLKVIGFNDYADKSMISLLNKALPAVKVQSKSELYPGGAYAGPKGCALVIHNNSDAFGQNIETEGETSLDGVIGCYSDAALVLKRNRFDLFDFMI